MNGIERIIQNVKAEIGEEIERILGDAKAEARRIADSYSLQAKADAEEQHSRNINEAAELEERLVSMGQMEARRVQLAAKQEMVEKAYECALEKLCAMPEAEYTQVLAGLLVKASGAGRGEVMFSPKDQTGVGPRAVELANQRLGGAMTVSEENRNIRGGFILRDGNVEVNCAFETLVRLQKAETAGAVAKKLFPKG